jgi:hypothetical protein
MTMAKSVTLIHSVLGEAFVWWAAHSTCGTRGSSADACEIAIPRAMKIVRSRKVFGLRVTLCLDMS